MVPGSRPVFSKRPPTPAAMLPGPRESRYPFITRYLGNR